MAPRPWEETAIVALLRFGGVLTGCAFGAVLLPVEWMAAVHSAIGLGAFPRAPIVDYLSRSLSVLYGFHGVFLLLVSTDVRRYRVFVLYSATMAVAAGLAFLGIDLHAGLPLCWTLTEGPPLSAAGLAMLWLVRRLDRRSSPGGRAPGCYNPTLHRGPQNR